MTKKTGGIKIIRNGRSDSCNASHGKFWEESDSLATHPFKGLDLLLVYEEVVKLMDKGWTSDSPVMVGFNHEPINFWLK